MDRQIDRKVAIIGFGPRGLGALEALLQGANSRGHNLKIDIFDVCAKPGAGPNFDPREPSQCLLNIPLRDIQLRSPADLDVLSFKDWVAPAVSEDAFPPRPDFGRYLQHRFAQLALFGSKVGVTQVPETVDSVLRTKEGWCVNAGSNSHGPYDEILIVAGQPPIHPDEQLAEWQVHAGRTGAELVGAYPAHRLKLAATNWAGRTVAVRGFGLSSFDVIRILTLGMGGVFDDEGYISSGKEPACIVPFSLDGQPPYPKPETGEVDARYKPTPAETGGFVRAVSKASIGSAADAKAFLTDALIPSVHRILSSFTVGTSDALIRDWLEREWSAPGSQEPAPARDALTQGIAMAEGSLPPSIGYAVGQLWRKWQDPLRQGFNPADTPAVTAASMVSFDEGLKRYSFGPPISASRELLELIKAGIVTVDLAKDPEIAMTGTGWHLQSGSSNAMVEVMVDGVLPSPDPNKVRTSLVAELINAGYLSTLNDLGARTAPDGQLIDRQNQTVHGLSLLGRLALGSVIAVDSLHDCFGQASSRWAEGVLSRIT